MSAFPLLSVVVCSYNRAELLPGCLDTLAGQTLDPARYEVVVVDNNSTDATRAVAEGYADRLSNFRVVAEPRQGLSHARNRGWREALGGYVAYLDDDARTTPGWCERILADFAEVRPAPAAVGGVIVPWYQAPPPKWFSDRLETRSWGEEAGFLRSSTACYGFSGSNMAFPRELLATCGGFSTELGMVGGRMALGEETELFSRIYPDHPHFWYDPALRVHHLVPEKNMHLSYRCLRAFRSGAAVAHIEGRHIGFLRAARAAADLAIVLAGAPGALVRGAAGERSEAVAWLERLSSRVGYFFGSK